MLDLFGQSSDFDQAQSARLRRVEEKLDLILNSLGIKYDAWASFPPQAREAAKAGDKIGAIKAYRAATGAGLAEAKRAVELFTSGR